MTYRPFQFFTLLGSLPLGVGFLLCLRWIILYLGILGDSPDKSRVPSLVFAAILILIGFQLLMLGFVADLLGVNRKLLEDIQLRLRRAEVDQ